MVLANLPILADYEAMPTVPIKKDAAPIPSAATPFGCAPGQWGIRRRTPIERAGKGQRYGESLISSPTTRSDPAHGSVKPELR